MTLPDVINGTFEFVGGLMLWRNVLALYRDKQIKGVSLLTSAFFAMWGWWNLYYYPNLHQWMSFGGGLVIASANLVWVGQMLYYRTRRGGRS